MKRVNKTRLYYFLLTILYVALFISHIVEIDLMRERVGNLENKIYESTKKEAVLNDCESTYIQLLRNNK